MRPSRAAPSFVPVFVSIAALFAVLALAAGPLAGSARAEPDPTCREAARSLCGDAADRESFRECMHERRGEMPESCQKRAAERRERVQGFLDTCEADIQALCGDVEQGRGRVIRCLREAEAELTPACGDAMAELPEKPRHRKR